VGAFASKSWFWWCSVISKSVLIAISVINFCFDQFRSTNFKKMEIFQNKFNENNFVFVNFGVFY